MTEELAASAPTFAADWQSIRRASGLPPEETGEETFFDKNPLWDSAPQQRSKPGLSDSFGDPPRHPDNERTELAYGSEFEEEGVLVGHDEAMSHLYSYDDDVELDLDDDSDLPPTMVRRALHPEEVYAATPSSLAERDDRDISVPRRSDSLELEPGRQFATRMLAPLVPLALLAALGVLTIWAALRFL